MKEKVGIGIIGTGFARRVQIPAFLACENVEIVSVASGSIENAKSTAEEFGVKHFTDDWHKTASHNAVDLVCITTPPKLHREMTLFALEQNKPVLCEKPMAMNVAEADEMVKASRNASVLALIDHELRFQPGRLHAFQLLRDGVIGKIQHAKHNFRAPHRGDRNLQWNWWSDIEQGGGALGAINSHIIDSFNWLLETTVSNVFCQLQTHIKQRPDPTGKLNDVTTDDEANMLLRFADSNLTQDATGLVSVSMTELPEFQNRVELFGTEGAMRIESGGELFIAKPGETEWTLIDDRLGRPLAGVKDTGFPRGFTELALLIIEAIREGRTEIEHAATFEDGLKVQRVLDAARESDQVRKVVEISNADMADRADSHG